MKILNSTRNRIRRFFAKRTPLNDARLRENENLLHIGCRAFCEEIEFRNTRLLKKTFSTCNDGRTAIAAERSAVRLFGDKAWMPTWKKGGRDWYIRDLYPKYCRLDRIGPTLNDYERRRVAGQTLSIILDLFSRGYLHGDLHAGNLFLINDQLKLVDYETLSLSQTQCTFEKCYDITGQGEVSAWRTGNMGFSSAHPMSIASVLEVSLADAMEELSKILIEEARLASLTFKKSSDTGRHECRSKRVYSTFDLPGFSIGSGIAQRNCEMRYTQFGISEKTLRGSRLLDLGSNIGGMLLHAQRFGVGESLGIEYDNDKVDFARRIASFSNAKNIEFRRSDIDKLSVDNVSGPFDFVFCLAINSHVRNAERLFRLLGKATRRQVFFEGNAGTDVDAVQNLFLQNGFSEVSFIGNCLDDTLPENNVRPVMIATKG